jgi:mRNA interferase MazF
MALAKGDVLLVSFPFTDLSQAKQRPSVVLHTSMPKKEVTVCFISSQKIDQIFDDEFVLSDSDSDFSVTGLKIASKVCVSRIVTLSTQLGYRKLGRLSDSQVVILNKKLCKVFQLS